MYLRTEHQLKCNIQTRDRGIATSAEHKNYSKQNLNGIASFLLEREWKRERGLTFPIFRYISNIFYRNGCVFE
jgi:hypothetical protein